MPTHCADDRVTVLHGDALDELRQLPDASVDSVVTDPPYGLGFMGKAWDDLPPGREWAEECLRVLKPGGHLLAFGGTRTWHRLAVAVEDAGFEIRDSIAWLYGSGFPKSLDVSKAIDKAAGAQRPVIGKHPAPAGNKAGGASLNMSVVGMPESADVTLPATPAAQQWSGWGTALKPSHEPVICARKPAGHDAILAEIGSHLDRLESECRHHASDAGPSSAPSPHDSHEAKTASAHAPAATQHAGAPATPTATGAAAGSSAATATSPSESTVATFSNTVTSWRACWVELCDLMSTCTTSTTSSQTTDLRTLSSCLSRITLDGTVQNTPAQGPSQSLVLAADNLFGASVLSSRSTLALSAVEPATASTPPVRPDAEGRNAAFEPIVVGRKPLQGTVAANVLAHGAGALNIDACRVGTEERTNNAGGASSINRVSRVAQGYRPTAGAWPTSDASTVTGRWPANVVLDGSQADALDQQSGNRPGFSTQRDLAPRAGTDGTTTYGVGVGRLEPGIREGYNDSGGASRFFPTFKYQAKAASRERPKVDGIAHPTVKPLELMRWLVRLVTPPDGVVLEPFAGSGTTVEACLLEGFRCIAIEREADYLPLIQARLDRARAAA